MLILLSASFAQDDLALETYCFSSVASRMRVEKKLPAILVPSDKLESEKACLTVQMKPHRRELIQNYTRSLDDSMLVKFSSAEKKNEPCRLQVEKIRQLKKDTTNIQLSQQPDATTSEAIETSKDIMEITTLDNFSLTVSQDAIEGKCRFITKDTYEILISARRDPKPLVPADLPPGTIVIAQTPPPEQKTISVSTTLQLRRGDKVEIGSIVRDLRKKENAVDLNPEATVSNTAGQEEEKVFLSFQ